MNLLDPAPFHSTVTAITNGALPVIFDKVWVANPTSQTTSNTYHGSWADYDNDGFLDLLLEHSPGLLYLNNLRQQANQNHWLKMQLSGKASNPNGLGAKIRVKATIGGKTVWQMRQIGVLPVYATELLAHFGLGDATKVDTLRIEWPSGIVQEIADVDANQFLMITETQNPPGPPPQVASSGRAADGAFELTVSCAADSLRYVLEGSTDLTQWTKVQVRTNLTGTMEFRDPFATNRI